MPSTIDQTGLTIEQKAQIVADLVAGYQAIYGNDINTDSNSPDGQRINIEAQMVSDFNEMLNDVYQSFGINTAYGAALDSRVGLNGIFRKQGTFTIAQVLVTTNKAITIPGLDQTAQTPFTVADNAGNQFQLVTSAVFGSASSQTLAFQAVTLGQVQTTANTITNIITSTLGVTTVNNPSVSSDTIGVNEETDSQLRTRHAQSLALASTGPGDAIEAALRNIPDVVDAFVVENDTGAPVNTVPANSIWAIVNGGTAMEIADAIYTKKGIGCGMKGSQSQIVTRPNGQTFTAQWDLSLSQPLYIAFGIIWKGAPTLQDSDIESQLAAALSYKLGQQPSISDVFTALQAIAPTAIPTLNGTTQGVSTNGSTWASLVSPVDAQHYYTVSAANVNIT